jgi:hypothetical protein
LYKKSFGLSVVIVVFIAAILGVSACQSSTYKTLSVTEGIQPFSFEYSKEYSLVRLSIENSNAAAYTSCQLRSNDNLSEMYLDVWIPGSSITSAAQIIDGVLENAQATLKNYLLVDNETIMVGDTTAFQAVFTADGALNSEEGSDSVESSSKPATFRITSMMLSGLVVEINMTCDQTIYNSAAKQYEHLIDSFAMTG